MKQVFEYIDSDKESAIEMLSKLVSQPSVAATGEGIQECSKLVVKLLEELGASPKIHYIGKGSPVVSGEIRSRKKARCMGEACQMTKENSSAALNSLKHS